ncbi:hypothetical protein BUALT_Bualt03G0211200 [Buddleja alternifolia]|uniref:Uncharacterized protein n=1 Tax=Buddleja alternifolia TaxID=168488 RepID=A0AAV6XZX7_9LAMI|nr:hypothetical protein BUALT_Bualt03G0211200 [Buddleja alternifolia]
MQQQMQLLNEQMQHNNRGKSILGEGPSMVAKRGSNSNPGRNNIHLTTENSNSSYTPFPRVEFPHFDGDNPRGWILRCNRYFQVISTIPEEQKVALASVYLDGKAEMWFDDYDPELIVESFNKLNQTEFFLVSFVGGLRDDIMSMKPKDFHQAVTLAKKQEGTVDAIIKRANLASKNFTQSKPAYRHIPSNHSQPRSPQIPPKPPFQNQSEPTQNHRKLLIASEMRARREKNLCYNCDETFVPSHRCKQRQIYMIMSEEEELIHNSQLSNEINNEIEEEMIDDDMTVSLNALSGTTDMNTLRIQRSVKGQDVHILIDNGSTHCFLDEITTHKLESITTTVPLWISEVQESYIGDSDLSGIIQQKAIDPQAYPEFHHPNLDPTALAPLFQLLQQQRNLQSPSNTWHNKLSAAETKRIF